MNKLLKTLLTNVVKFAVSSATTVTLLGASAAVSAQDIKGDAKVGQSKAAMCIGCHGIVGYQASFPEIYKVPKISGQGAKFIVSLSERLQKR